jgi:DNA-binding MarR family transcriptional regulator
MRATKAASETSVPASVELGVLNEVLGFHVRRLHKRMTRRFAEGVGDTGARPGAFTALALISANPGVSQTALAREMGFDKATIVALIDSLEALGWAVRERAAADRRRHSLGLTRAGEAALKRLRQLVLVVEAPVRGALSAPEIRRLVELLDRANEALERADD